jgi:hypothetical protein
MDSFRILVFINPHIPSVGTADFKRAVDDAPDTVTAWSYDERVT